MKLYTWQYQPINMRIFFCFLLTLISLGFLAINDAEAATKYKVTPRVIDKEVDRRDIFTEIITVENLSPSKITIFPIVNAIEVDSGGDITEFVPQSIDKNKAESITSWISIRRAGLELQIGEKVDIPISFHIHQDAVPGNYQAFVGFATGQNILIAEKQVIEGQAPGTTVTLAVEQNQTEFLKLKSFSIERFVLEPENQAIKYTLSNPGEVAIVPRGEIIFYNGRGDEAGSVEVNPEQESLVPGQETTFTLAAPTDGYFGKYKAFLSVDYGTTQISSVYDTVYFYVVPWQRILIIFAIVLLLTIILVVLIHRSLRPKQLEDDPDVIRLPLHQYEGVSSDKDHDINLKN